MPYYPPQPERRQDHPPQKRKALRWVILCFSAMIFIYGAARLIGYAADYAASRRTAEELRALAEAGNPAPAERPGASDEMQSAAPETAAPESAAPATAEPVTPAPAAARTDRPAAKANLLPPVEYPNGYELVSRIRQLRRKNENIIGWLTMDDLDEPVVQKDNTFFLTHDAAGKRNSNGAVFMDKGTGLLTRPYTILLYGHNMKSGAMFGNLQKYEKFSYYYRHRFLQFDTLYEEGRYVIFAVSRISLTAGKSRYVSLPDLQSTDREARKSAIKALTGLSPHGSLVDVSEEDQLLLLITCTGDDDERLIAAARRLRPDE